MINLMHYCVMLLSLTPSFVVGLEAQLSRRSALRSLGFAAGSALIAPHDRALAKCSDIESCREIGNAKVEEEQRRNPTYKLPGGVRYKMVQAGTGDDVVGKGDIVDIKFSISQANGAYMYSVGRGFEKEPDGASDEVTSYRVRVGNLVRDVPVRSPRSFELQNAVCS